MPHNWKTWHALAGLLTLLVAAAPGRTQDVPPWLPLYDLDVEVRTHEHCVRVRQRVTWTNRHERPAREMVFNAHSHYSVPDADVGFLAKTLELLRVTPNEGIDFDGPALHVERAALEGHGDALPFRFDGDTRTDLVLPLPRPVAAGDCVTVVLDFTLRLPQKQGRWGQWKGVTYLSHWLPVLSYYDECGWHPTPFIPWHQPFFNESGVYNVRLTLPCEERVAHAGTLLARRDLGDGRQQLDVRAAGVRDFSLIASAQFCEACGEAGPVKVRCLHLPEHEHYGREMVKTACDVIPVYGRWLGPYPYPEFTIVESYFGWNGNECSTLVMIDERVFGMPHLAAGYVEYLICHETCHQWFYNVIGTNGYAETWMDEAMATHFSHRYLNQKHGRNSPLLKFPSGLGWLPNIQRSDYRSYGLYGTLGRGEETAIVQEMPKFGHIVTLFAMCYDKGSRVVAMIEDRLGETAFLDFMRRVYCRYQFRVLTVADYRRELEEYTGQSWEEFFQNWLYGKGVSDWCVEKVQVTPSPWASSLGGDLACGTKPRCRAGGKGPCRVTVLLHQKADYNEQTTLGIRLVEGDGYQVRVPVVPGADGVDLDDPPAVVRTLPDNRVCVEVELPCRPLQIAVDPDQLIPDRNPTNNFWKTCFRVRLTPAYTALDETDVTNAHDRWNVTVGPWIYGTAYNDPWFTRSSMIGLRAGVYRTQRLNAGAYLAYRNDFRDVAIGADGVWDHTPWPRTQVGFSAEKSLGEFGGGGTDCDRAVVFGRYVFQYGSSLYLPPIRHLEVFAATQDDCLPFPERRGPGAIRFEDQTTVGVHYHIDYLTPYWDADAGYRFDATFAEGLPVFGQQRSFRIVTGQFSTVRALPDLSGHCMQYLPALHDTLEPSMRWLGQTRLALRVFGAAGFPDSGEYFALGGSQLFRGFALDDRQGSSVVIGSVEWRLPLAKGLHCDVCDHVVGLRNAYGAVFYDVGNVKVNGGSVGPAAHAVGGGLRLDLALFGFMERATLRLDVAKTVNDSTPVQVWLGFQHPF